MKKFLKNIFIISLIITALFWDTIIYGQPSNSREKHFINPEIISTSKWVNKDQDIFIPPPEAFKKKLKSGMPGEASIFQTTFHNFPDSVEKVFEYALSVWDFYLNTPIKIRIGAYWEELNGNTLGATGVNDYFTNFGGAPVKDLTYPVGLAEK